MDHNDIRHKLSDYIDTTVTQQERAIIDEHLKTCAECSAALIELRKTIAAVKRIEEVEPPAWMTQKIMANVREEADQKKSIFQRIFFPLAVKLPIQVVGVLFLTVTAYYIYTNTNPAEKYKEAPVSRIAKQEAPSKEHDSSKFEAADAPAVAEKKFSQEPGYKSLDMKYSYEKPAPPVPAGKGEDAPAAPSPTLAKRDAISSDMDDAVLQKRASSPKPQAAAPAMMAEQAASKAGALQHQGPAPETAATAQLKADQEAEARLAIAERFAKTDLPKKMKKKGLFYTIRSFQDNPADLQWMKDMTAFRANPCANRYVVDVDLSGSLSKYLYCADRSPVKLLGVYELRDGAWTEKKRP